MGRRSHFRRGNVWGAFHHGSGPIEDPSLRSVHLTVGFYCSRGTPPGSPDREDSLLVEVVLATTGERVLVEAILTAPDSTLHLPAAPVH